MTYVVTYCTLDRTTGSNPLWHSCLLLSKVTEDNKLEVIEYWSFYGVPTTNAEHSWLRDFKIRMKVDVDLHGNHGMLIKEEVRRLCLGRGLHGANFELTKEQFETLQQNCRTMITDQEAAIREVVDTQHLAATKSKVRLYPEEHRSLLIFELEKIKAAQKGQPPRLKPFEFRISFGLTGPSLANSSTCKSQVIELLATVLSPKQIARLTENGTHPTVPRFSGPMEPIYLHCTGPLRIHTKDSGEQVHYPDNKDPIRVFWTLPPQYIEALSAKTYDLFYIDEELIDETKVVISRLQQLEYLCRDAIVPSEFRVYRDDLVKHIVSYYNSFAVMTPNRSYAKKPNDWGNFALSLFAVPQNKDERLLKAKLLFNAMYMAIVENWKIRPEAKSEGIQFTRPVADSVLEDKIPVEAWVAAHFPVKKQMELCKLIGRSYCRPEVETDEIAVVAVSDPEEELVYRERSIPL